MEDCLHGGGESELSLKVKVETHCEIVIQFLKSSTFEYFYTKYSKVDDLISFKAYVSIYR